MFHENMFFLRESALESFHITLIFNQCFCVTVLDELFYRNKKQNPLCVCSHPISSGFFKKLLLNYLIGKALLPQQKLLTILCDNGYHLAAVSESTFHIPG